MTFSLGRLVATPGALAAFAAASDNPIDYLIRHFMGDWADVDADDRQANEEALTLGNRLVSAYRLKDQTRIWIITEADRSVTTILLPEEY